jgi:hypothetical protein
MRSRQSIGSFSTSAQELFSELLPQLVMIAFLSEMTFDGFQLPEVAVFVCVCHVSAGSAVF